MGSRRRWLPGLLPPLLLMALIAFLSHQQLPVGLQQGSDKLVHGLVYALLGWLWCRALVRGGFGWVAGLATALAISCLWGLIDEWHQSFVPGRSAERMDAIADVVGAGVGSVLAALVARTHRGPDRSAAAAAEETPRWGRRET